MGPGWRLRGLAVSLGGSAVEVGECRVDLFLEGDGGCAFSSLGVG